MTEREDYAFVQKLLHWAIVVLVVGMLVGGNVMTALGWPDPETAATTNFLYMMHKSTGLVILGLMALRVLARILYGAPLQDPTIPAIQRFVAGLTHLLLYVLLIAMPLVGWMATTAGNYLEPVYGVIAMPALHPADVCAAAAPALDLFGLGFCAEFVQAPGKEQSEQLFAVHGALAFAIVAVAALHILGALYHLLVRQDGVFGRMWFRGPSPERLK